MPTHHFLRFRDSLICAVFSAATLLNPGAVPAQKAGAQESETAQDLSATGDVDPLAKELANNQNTNRLAKESSPYLLQHAHNPVDWYPWSFFRWAMHRVTGVM